jgi:hypothetical protein
MELLWDSALVLLTIVLSVLDLVRLTASLLLASHLAPLGWGLPAEFVGALDIAAIRPTQASMVAVVLSLVVVPSPFFSLVSQTAVFHPWMVRLVCAGILLFQLVPPGGWGYIVRPMHERGPPAAGSRRRRASFSSEDSSDDDEEEEEEEEDGYDSGQWDWVWSVGEWMRLVTQSTLQTSRPWALWVWAGFEGLNVAVTVFYPMPSVVDASWVPFTAIVTVVWGLLALFLLAESGVFLWNNHSSERSWVPLLVTVAVVGVVELVRSHFGAMTLPYASLIVLWCLSQAAWSATLVLVALYLAALGATRYLPWVAHDKSVTDPFFISVPASTVERIQAHTATHSNEFVRMAAFIAGAGCWMVSVAWARLSQTIERFVPRVAPAPPHAVLLGAALIALGTIRAGLFFARFHPPSDPFLSLTSATRAFIPFV